MSAPDLDALGASPHFSWLGMRATSKRLGHTCHGYVLRVYSPVAGAVLGAVARVASVDDNGEIINACEYLTDLVLDLDDPGNKGRLLALVREAWGDPCIHVCGDGITWCVMDGHLDSITKEFIETEAEALTAALLAAPPKGGE